MPGRGSAVLDWEGSCWKTMYVNRTPTLCHTGRRLQFWLTENFCNFITTKNSPDHKHQRWTEGKDNCSIYQFKLRHHQKTAISFNKFYPQYFKIFSFNFGKCKSQMLIFSFLLNLDDNLSTTLHVYYLNVYSSGIY